MTAVEELHESAVCTAPPDQTEPPGQAVPATPPGKSCVLRSRLKHGLMLCCATRQHCSWSVRNTCQAHSAAAKDLGCIEPTLLGNADVAPQPARQVLLEAPQTGSKALDSTESVLFSVSTPRPSTASQTDADSVLSPERYRDLLRTLTTRSAVLAGKNAKLREDRDRLQARRIRYLPSAAPNKIRITIPALSYVLTSPPSKCYHSGRVNLRPTTDCGQLDAVVMMTCCPPSAVAGSRLLCCVTNG